MATNYSYLDSLDRMRSGNKSTLQSRQKRSTGGSFGTSRTSTRGGGGSFAAPTTSASTSGSRTSTRGGGGSFGTAPAPTRAPVPVTAPPPPTSAPAPVNRMAAPAPTGGGGGGGWNYSSIAPSATGSYGGTASMALGADPSTMLSDEDYLPTDSVYVAEAAGIESDVQALLDALKRDRAAYDIDFGSALRNLGWSPEGEDFSRGQWRQQDLTGAYGSAYNNMQNDFAGRGMLTSSFYGSGLEDLISSFDQQRGDMLGARQRQMDTWTAEQSEAESQKRQALDRARAAALARRASGLQLTGF